MDCLASIVDCLCCKLRLRSLAYLKHAATIIMEICLMSGRGAHACIATCIAITCEYPQHAYAFACRLYLYSVMLWKDSWVVYFKPRTQVEVGREHREWYDSRSSRRAWYVDGFAMVSSQLHHRRRHFVTSPRWRLPYAPSTVLYTVDSYSADFVTCNSRHRVIDCISHHNSDCHPINRTPLL